MNTKPSKEQIINQAIKFHLQGNIAEATKYYQYCINQKFQDPRVFSNYGIILKSFGKLKEAEYFYRKAIELSPDFVDAYSNLGNIMRDIGKLKEAEYLYRKAIEINPNLAIGHSNLGNILKDVGKLKEAEYFYRKAIELNPALADAYSNLGTLLLDLGKLKEAEYLYRKAIELNPDLAIAYYSLSLFQVFDAKTIWRKKLFSKNFLNNKSKNDQVNIYFARANILHKEKNYEESYKSLKLANQLKLILKPSNAESLINQSKVLLIESDKKDINQEEKVNYPQSIFIVGMPRSGSTLLESILSMSNDVYDLGETNFLEESFLEWKKSKQKINELYGKKVINKTKLNITTNKWLYNYQYAGIIARHIPNSKIIHCYRNPLDNILSIYRTHFFKKNQYSSSLGDCANVYLDQEEIMTEYKKRFRAKIYDFNYDLLVSNPNEEIKSLISWLGWKWDDQYLSPHLNPRSISTASIVQVRSPINSKSVGGWKNYKEMLRPAMEIITQEEKYKNLKY